MKLLLEGRAIGNGQWAIEEDFDETPVFQAGFAEGADSRHISDFRDLEVWKESMNLVTAIYAETRSFPKEEQYGLTSQMRRAAVSVPFNIAEGYGRGMTGQYVQFLRISLGSAKELETLIEISRRVMCLSESKAEVLNTAALRIARMLRGLMRALERP